jgi:hypothetical protein
LKCISLWQPWASAIAAGSKRIETRSWATNYTGLIAIHAAKRCVVEELNHFSCSMSWQGAMRPIVGLDERPWSKVLPFGAIVAVALLTRCRPTAEFTIGEIEAPRSPEGSRQGLYNWTERQMGDFTIGRYGWMLENVRCLPLPIPFCGRQGLFNVPDELLEGRAA